MSAFVHMELSTTDPKKAVAFYEKLFGWKFEHVDMGPAGTYSMFRAPSGPGGGIQGLPMEGQPAAWLAYVGVASLDAAMAKAKSLGATPILERQEVPGMGVLGIFNDPTGATIALWEPTNMPPPAPKKAARKPAAKNAKKAPAKAAKKPAPKAKAKKRR